MRVRRMKHYVAEIDIDCVNRSPGRLKYKRPAGPER